MEFLVPIGDPTTWLAHIAKVLWFLPNDLRELLFEYIRLEFGSVRVADQHFYVEMAKCSITWYHYQDIDVQVDNTYSITFFYTKDTYEYKYHLEPTNGNLATWCCQSMLQWPKFRAWGLSRVRWIYGRNNNIPCILASWHSLFRQIQDLLPNRHEQQDWLLEWNPKSYCFYLFTIPSMEEVQWLRYQSEQVLYKAMDETDTY